MTMLTVSSKGQVVLPAALRRRLGLGVGAQLEVVEEADGVRLRVARSVAARDIATLAGLVSAPAADGPRRLQDFDPAFLLERRTREGG